MAPLDKLRLRFPDELERDFREDYFKKSLNPLRFGIVLGALIYVLFGILDAWITPEFKYKAWFVRYAVILPTCIAVLLFSFSAHFKKYMQSTVFLLVLIAGTGIIALISIVSSPLHYLHFAGLLLVIMYSHTFSKLRFYYTTIACWTLVAIYEVCALWINHTPLQDLLTDNFFYIAANLIGMFSSYQRELYARKDFFQSRMMQVLEKERHLIEKTRMHATVEKAIKSLRESEEKFRTLAETAAMGIFIHQGGNFLYANRAAQVIGGYPVDEYLTMHFMSLVHPDYVELVRTRAQERLRGDSDVPPQYEFKLVRKDGQERWVLMTGGITEYDGKPAVIGTIIDITARKQAEEERAQMALLVENSSDLIAMSSLDGKMIFVNSAGRRLVGIDPGTDVKKTVVTDYFFPEDLPVHAEHRSKKDWRGEFRLRNLKTGAPIPVDMYIFDVTNGQTGETIARAGVMRDITDLKRAREERERYYQQLQRATQSLRESEARFRTLAETTSAGIVIHRGGRFLYVNPAVPRMTGYSQQELLTSDFWELVHPDFRDMMRDRGSARLQGGEEPTDYEFKILAKGGVVRWVSLTAGVIEYEGSPAVIATLFDVTDRKHAEEEKVKLYEQRIAEEKRHLSEKEEILMDLHDGIGGITTNVSILSEVGQKSTNIESIKHTLSTISRLSREGITEIRSFMQSLDSRELTWHTMIAELRNLGAKMLHPHNLVLSVETSLSDGLEQPGSFLWINVIKIYKEALTNVIKHSKAGSVAVDMHISDCLLRLMVKDDGVGCKCNGTGSKGRGLSNMQRRAERLGGSLVVDSEQGTTVSLSLPLPIKYPARGIEN